jgi:hypothetical protein
VSGGPAATPSSGGSTLPSAVRGRFRPGAWQVTVTRPDRRVTLFEVRLSEYREFFLVAVGEKSIAITSLDPSDATHLEPQCFVFAKPYGWDDDLEGEEALLQVWQAVGVQR